jgi:hypothetical protein
MDPDKHINAPVEFISTHSRSRITSVCGCWLASEGFPTGQASYQSETQALLQGMIPAIRTKTKMAGIDESDLPFLKRLGL